MSAEPEYRSSWVCDCGTRCRSTEPAPPADGRCRECHRAFEKLGGLLAEKDEEIARLRAALLAAKIGCDERDCRVELVSYDSPCDCDPERDGPKHNAAIDKALEGST